MIRLGVNIDHVATLRQARGTRYPDPIQAALEAEQAGADAITLHLREDRRHIQEHDVEALRRVIQTRMNLEMAVTDDMVAFACRLRPQDCCLVPERRQELTTEGGLDVVSDVKKISDACRRLAAVMREKALATLAGATYRLIEVKFGNYPRDLERGGRMCRAGSPIAWKPDEIQAGRLVGRGADGTEAEVGWDEVALDPGWCKLDWVIADPNRHSLANASNMLDVTWEAPDGTITPLDGYLDPYFQEVYLDATSVPIFAKLSKHVSADALDNYVAALQREVKKYLTKDLNYGKVAKRLYNIFRLTGHYAEAAYIRELFDEPTALLYQVWSLLSTIENLGAEGSPIDIPTVQHQMDSLIKNVIDTCEGPLESQIVIGLLQLKDNIAGRSLLGERYVGVVTDSQRAVIELVNLYFRERLYALPEVAQYLEALREEPA